MFPIYRPQAMAAEHFDNFSWSQIVILLRLHNLSFACLNSVLATGRIVLDVPMSPWCGRPFSICMISNLRKFNVYIFSCEFALDLLQCNFQLLHTYFPSAHFIFDLCAAQMFIASDLSLTKIDHFISTSTGGALCVCCVGLILL